MQKKKKKKSIKANNIIWKEKESKIQEELVENWITEKTKVIIK